MPLYIIWGVHVQYGVSHREGRVRAIGRLACDGTIGPRLHFLTALRLDCEALKVSERASISPARYVLVHIYGVFHREEEGVVIDASPRKTRSARI